MTEFHETLQRGISEIGIPCSSAQLDSLYRYAQELALWNEKINLIGDTDILNRHILDSLAPYNEIAALSPGYICDVGTGAGLPGIPLAVVFPDIHFVLNDRMGKRMGFLRSIVPLMGLGNRVSLSNCPVRELKERFDCVVMRAFRPFPDFLKETGHLVASGGTIAVYLGEEVDPGIRRCINMEYSFLKGRRHLGLLSREEIDVWMDGNQIGKNGSDK